MCYHFIVSFACSYLFLGSAEFAYISSHSCMPVLSVLVAGDLVTLRHLQGNSLQEQHIAYFTSEFKKSHDWLFKLYMLAG